MKPQAQKVPDPKAAPLRLPFYALPALFILTLALPLLSSAQTAFVDFTEASQFTTNFNLWHDIGGADGGNYDFVYGPAAGVDNSGGVSVFQSTDTTATYQADSWDFSTNGSTIILSVMIKANGQTSGNKVQLGVLNSDANGLNSNGGITFESFRFIPVSSTSWSLREQFRTNNVTAPEVVLGNVNVNPGTWYKFVLSLTNTSGPTGNYSAACALLDYGADGLTPGANVVTFATLQNHAAQEIAMLPSVWPALRAFRDAGIDSWDNFLVYTKNSPPVITWPLTNLSVTAGSVATLAVLADGPGSISYAWFTNGVLVPGVSGPTYMTPPLNSGYTNISVVASNPNGTATNTVTASIFTPTVAQITNLPASIISSFSATLNGKVTSTGGNPPLVTIYYGPTNGGANTSAWAHSVVLGVRNDLFSQSVSALTPETTYYYTARAVNNAGAVWAAPAQQFSTLAANLLPVAVLSQHNDHPRTGANLNESILHTANVNTNQFGLLYTRAVNDQVYAQPLIATNVDIPGKGVHNVVYVCTLNNGVYAFDADDGSVSNAYWQVSFVGNFNGTNAVAPRNTDMTGACGGNYNDFSGNMGIVSTPVIDPAAGTLYLVARTKEMTASTTNYVQRLHALDLRTGAERSNSPVVITATYAGTGAGNIGGIIAFDPQKHNQRSGLTLVNGVVYIGWASHCDWGPYHGWLMGYDAVNLQRVVTYMTTRNGSAAGIWMSGAAPASDENGNLYISTGNGSVGVTGNRADLNNRGESLLKLTRNGPNLNIASWFTPYNWQVLENGDIDLGSGGVLLIPGTTLALSGGKEGKLYLVNRDNMGGLSGSPTADTNVVQSWQVTGLNSPNDLHGAPVWWDGPDGSYAYIWGEFHYLNQYKFDWATGKFFLPQYAQSLAQAPNGMPGGILSLSAQGANAGSGILWASHQFSGDANQQVRPGILRAFDGQDVSRELWNSEQFSARDSVGNFAKFVPPTVANGKVYLATFSNRLLVYGLLPRPSLTIRLSGSNAILNWPTNGVFNYKLQRTLALAPPAWSDVTNTVTISNGFFQVTTPASSAATFYRLVK